MSWTKVWGTLSTSLARDASCSVLSFLSRDAQRYQKILTVYNEHVQMKLSKPSNLACQAGGLNATLAVNQIVSDSWKRFENPTLLGIIGSSATKCLFPLEVVSMCFVLLPFAARKSVLQSSYQSYPLHGPFKTEAGGGSFVSWRERPVGKRAVWHVEIWLILFEEIEETRVRRVWRQICRTQWTLTNMASTFAKPLIFLTIAGTFGQDTVGSHGSKFI